MNQFCYTGDRPLLTVNQFSIPAMQYNYVHLRSESCSPHYSRGLLLSRDSIDRDGHKKLNSLMMATVKQQTVTRYSSRNAPLYDELICPESGKP